jgi:hypothetical protein
MLSLWSVALLALLCVSQVTAQSQVLQLEAELPACAVSFLQIPCVWGYPR